MLLQRERRGEGHGHLWAKAKAHERHLSKIGGARASLARRVDIWYDYLNGKHL